MNIRTDLQSIITNVIQNGAILNLGALALLYLDTSWDEIPYFTHPELTISNHTCLFFIFWWLTYKGIALLINIHDAAKNIWKAD